MKKTVSARLSDALTGKMRQCIQDVFLQDMREKGV